MLIDAPPVSGPPYLLFPLPSVLLPQVSTWETTFQLSALILTDIFSEKLSQRGV